MPILELIVLIYCLTFFLDAIYQAGGTNWMLDVLQALPTLLTDVPPVKIPVPVWTR